MPTKLQILTATVTVNEMLKGGHFSICTIDKAAKVLGLNRPSGEAYDMLNALHCVDFANMPQELYQELPGLIQQVLGTDTPFQFETVHFTPRRPQVAWIEEVIERPRHQPQAQQERQKLSWIPKLGNSARKLLS